MFEISSDLTPNLFGQSHKAVKLYNTERNLRVAEVERRLRHTWLKRLKISLSDGRRCRPNIKALPTTTHRQSQLSTQHNMNSLRIARTALRARSAAFKTPLQRRGYAEAVSDKVGNSEQIFSPLLILSDQTELGSSTSGTLYIIYL